MHGAGLVAAPEQHRIRTYEGSEPVAVFLDSGENEAALVRVVVNRPDRDLAIELSSYDPVVWDVATTPGTRVVAAFVSGFHGQAVVGLPAATPVLVRSDRYSAGTNCSDLEFGQAKHAVYGNTMQAVASDQYSYETAMAIVGDRNYDPTTLVRSEVRTLAEYSLMQ
jgi:hypothetical protein